MFNTASTASHQWTQTWLSSIQLPSSQHISLRSILLLCSDYYLGFPIGCFPSSTLHGGIPILATSQAVTTFFILLPWQLWRTCMKHEGIRYVNPEETKCFILRNCNNFIVQSVFKHKSLVSLHNMTDHVSHPYKRTISFWSFAVWK
jgi:hypothetical protein